MTLRLAQTGTYKRINHETLALNLLSFSNFQDLVHVAFIFIFNKLATREMHHYLILQT